ncbi:hypothetical protein F4678DRAFT_260577 [Xylaria arbuscula]|nr:hypothetical protein F4678DRAFT_260577 [Xylaria arbuscula]
MENPEKEISGVIRLLTQGTKTQQGYAINDYFTKDAYFNHPFCRVPSFEPREVKVPFVNSHFTITSRFLVQLIYQWYKIMSPKIELQVDSTSFDKASNSLYATIRQTFTIWIVPFSLWQANVKLVSLLELVYLPVDDHLHPLPSSYQSTDKNGHMNGHAEGHNRPDLPEKLYFIRGQQDFYQLDDALKFIAPLGAAPLYFVWQLFATFLSALGVALLWPVTPIYERFVTIPRPNDGKVGRRGY